MLNSEHIEHINRLTLENVILKDQNDKLREALKAAQDFFDLHFIYMDVTMKFDARQALVKVRTALYKTFPQPKQELPRGKK